MPTVFLSYSRDDLPFIEQLEGQLKNHSEISIWRDQDKIYGGQKWPKVLGEAIADQDVFLLAWSKNSADSHFVGFEWETAIALKKKIVPYLLDSTTLPPSLVATHGIPVGDIPRIIAALTGAVPTEDVARRAEVVSKLDQVSATKPKDVLTAAKTSFDQRNWTVHGNIIQGENVTVQIGQRVEKRRKGLEKWQTWLSLAVGVLIAVTLILWLLDKLPWSISPDAGGKAFDQPLAGQVIDASNGDPLPGVRISILNFKIDPQTTNDDGHFRFDKLSGTKQKGVKLTVGKDCYKVETIEATLGNTDLRPALEKLDLKRCQR